MMESRASKFLFIEVSPGYSLTSFPGKLPDRALLWRHYTTVPAPYQILSLDRDRSLFLAVGTGPKETNRFAFSPEIGYNASRWRAGNPARTGK
jgi:hypothetical protein